MSTYRSPISVRQQTGLTLVEMLVAVALSMVLMAGVFQIFISSKQTYRVQNELGRLQENARFAMGILTHDIRMAGNIGCNQAADLTDLTVGTLLDGIKVGIEGFEQDSMSVGDTPNGLTLDDIATDTDLIFLKGVSSVAYNVTNTMTHVDNNITLVDNPFETNDVAIIADCKSVDIFTVDSVVGGTDINPRTSLTKLYGPDAQVMRPYFVVYYIAPDANNNNVRNLYRKVLNDTGTAGLDSEPLIEGIENIQIEYGEDVGGNGLTTRYVDADAAGLNMEHVTAIRIHLLVATQDQHLASEPQTYTLNGAQTTSTDRRLFRTMTTTIVLRNSGDS